MRASELRFRRLFETARDGILILDATTHRILEANPFILKLLGCSKKALIGKKLFELGILSDALGCQEMFEQFPQASSIQFEDAVRHPGAARIIELEFVCSCYDEAGRTLIQCNIRDMAARREGERRLREALGQLALAKKELETRVLERTADLQQRNAELEAFSYSLSHDLRAPIRAIVSFIQLALEESNQHVSPASTEFLQKAVNSAQRLDHLILDVLAFSKITRQPLAPEKIDVGPLLREILQERPEWAPPRAQIIMEGRFLPILGDRASLTQCLTNMIGNAVKFVPSGAEAQVRVSTEAHGTRVRVCVEDNGIGIPRSAQERVFEMFQRAHNGYEGSGIGLAIVRRAAERMGGTVGLSSTPGKGSKFWVDLPGAAKAAKDRLNVPAS